MPALTAIAKDGIISYFNLPIAMQFRKTQDL
jgi:hypothetical protein